MFPYAIDLNLVVKNTLRTPVKSFERFFIIAPRDM